MIAISIIENCLKTRLNLGNCGLKNLEVIPELLECTHIKELILNGVCTFQVLTFSFNSVFFLMLVVMFLLPSCLSFLFNFINTQRTKSLVIFYIKYRKKLTESYPQQKKEGGVEIPKCFVILSLSEKKKPRFRTKMPIIGVLLHL